jgi:hypothetical protein
MTVDDELELKPTAQVKEEAVWADEDGILGADEFDELMAAVGDEVVASRTTCQKWEDDHPPIRAPTRSPSPATTSALPARKPSGSASSTKPASAVLSALSDLTNKSADPVEVIDLDLEDEHGPAPDFGDDGWNVEDDEQAEQDDPGEDDFDNGLGEDDDFDGALAGDGYDDGVSYDDGVIIMDGDEEEVRISIVWASQSCTDSCPFLASASEVGRWSSQEQLPVHQLVPAQPHQAPFATAPAEAGRVCDAHV